MLSFYISLQKEQHGNFFPLAGEQSLAQTVFAALWWMLTVASSSVPSLSLPQASHASGTNCMGCRHMGVVNRTVTKVPLGQAWSKLLDTRYFALLPLCPRNSGENLSKCQCSDTKSGHYHPMCVLSCWEGIFYKIPHIQMLGKLMPELQF